MKKIITIALSSIMILAIGCSTQNSPEATLDTFFTSIQEGNINDAKETLNPEFAEKTIANIKEASNKVLIDEDHEDYSLKLSTLENYEVALGNVKTLNDRLQHEILEVQYGDDKNTAEAKVKITYADTKELFSETLLGSFATLFESAFSGKDLTPEENAEMILQMFNEKFSEATFEDATVETVINLKKVDNKWTIEKFGKDTLNALLFGSVNSFEKIFPEDNDDVKTVTLIIETSNSGSVLNVQSELETLEEILKENLKDTIVLKETPEGTVIETIKESSATEELTWEIKYTESEETLSPFVNLITIEDGDSISITLK